MKNTELIKAKCRVTGAAYAVEIRKIDSEWRAIDFVKLTAEQDSKFESQENVSELISADSLLPCTKCGGRKLGGCPVIWADSNAEQMRRMIFSASIAGKCRLTILPPLILWMVRCCGWRRVRRSNSRGGV